jgi:hypothetical protein
MATEPGYTVLPLSALKKLHKVLFEALKAEKTVYVSKHGRIVAAFRPYTYVPEGVAAVYASPNLDLPTITARDIQRTSLSKPIAAAAAWLPAVVEKDSRIYGMLTPATAPRPDTAPDPDTVGAKAEAILDYQQRNPTASIDEIMAFADSLDPVQEEQTPPRMWPLAAEFENADAVYADIKGWREQGSDIEDVVEGLFDVLGKGIEAAGEDDEISVQIVPDLAHLTPSHVAGTYIVCDLADYDGGFMPPSIRAFVLQTEQLEAAGERLDARARYVCALTNESLPNVGVMWRLGNLARHAGHPAEAARWFRFSLAYNAISDALERQR